MDFRSTLEPEVFLSGSNTYLLTGRAFLFLSKSVLNLLLAITFCLKNVSIPLSSIGKDNFNSREASASLMNSKNDFIYQTPRLRLI